MKTFILFLIATFSVIASEAQSLQATTYLEKTHFSPKYGTRVGFEFVNNFELGGFYQKSATSNLREEGRPATIEEVFYGAYFACPIVSRESASLKFNVRTGVSNGENFTITPSILGSYSPIRFISIGGGIGMRALRPTMMASVSFQIGG